MVNKETFTAHEYTIYGEKESAIVPGHMHTVEIGIGCPRCRTTNPPLEHGEERVCVKCGLHMQLFGNGLHVWADTVWVVQEDEPEKEESHES